MDITIPAGTEVDGDTGDEEGGDDTGEGEDKDKEVEDPSTGVMVPGVPLWYWNAVMKRLWENASESQKDVVERYKMECGRKCYAPCLSSVHALLTRYLSHQITEVGGKPQDRRQSVSGIVCTKKEWSTSIFIVKKLCI